MMNGGTLSVKDHKKFLNVYLEKVLLNEKQYMVEMKTQKFKFYIDFDFKDQLSDEDATELFLAWESAVKGPVYVAKTAQRIVDGYWKSGFHLIWPERIVKKQTYTRFRNSIILKTPHVADFIDSPTSGLRMLWSHKYPVGKPYVPWIRIHNGKVEQLSPVPNLHMLEKFSIQVFDDGDETSTKEEAIIQETSSKLETYIRKHIRGQEACNVKKIIRNKDSHFCIQTDSNYCENLGDRHKSNHVWFMIHSNRIQQKCHCTCDVKRKFGVTCKKFTGRAHILPHSILEELDKLDLQDDTVDNILDLF